MPAPPPPQADPGRTVTIHPDPTVTWTDPISRTHASYPNDHLGLTDDWPINALADADAPTSGTDPRTSGTDAPTRDAVAHTIDAAVPNLPAAQAESELRPWRRT